MKITITGPRSVGKSSVSKILAKKLSLKYISSDELGEKALKKYGGLDKAIKSKKIEEMIKEKGYSILLKQYTKKKFVFDLSIGSFSSNKFKKASKEIRICAKKNSIIFGLLPYRNDKKSINLLYSREIKRKHFLKSNKKELLERTKRRYPEQKEILLNHANHLIWTKEKTPTKIAKEIIKILKPTKTI